MQEGAEMSGFSFDWITTTIATAIGSIVSFLLGMRKNVAEARKAELDNIEQAITLWRETAQHQQVEIDNLRQQVNGLYAKVGELLRENASLNAEVARLKEINASSNLSIPASDGKPSDLQNPEVVPHNP